MTQELAKKKAAQAAAQLIPNHTRLGIGSGSTVDFFIEYLGHRIQTENLQIQALASSNHSFQKAKANGIHLLQDTSRIQIDITVDGADEIDPNKRMIKGGGGAHVREKILAYSSQKTIIIIDETKWVPVLGRSKLPLELMAYGCFWTEKALHRLGYQGTFRKNERQELLLTDNGGVLFDIDFPFPPLSPEEEHAKLIQIPGVVDTGFFFDLAHRVITGYLDGTVNLNSEYGSDF